MTVFGFGAQKKPPVIGDSGIPAYCLKRIGARHIVVAGGGGASKTGVLNEIQTHLFTTDQASQEIGLRAECVDTFDTESMATMNMDIACALDESAARYVIAAGQDNYCTLYMTRGFKTNETENSQLAFDIQKVSRIKTSDSPNDAFQKCVRFDRNSRGKIFATGGSDGHIRIWDAQQAFRSQNENAEPLVTIRAHSSAVDDLDFSADSKHIISVGSDGAFIWSTTTGERLLDLQLPLEIARGFRMRSARCTPLGNASKNTVFVAAYNAISCSTKDQAAYLSLWAFNEERRVARPIVTKCVVKGTISTLSVSECGNFTAIGTMSGGVGVYDTHECRRLYFSPDSHSLFVTGIEFMAKTCPSISEGVPETPGVSSGFQAAVVTLAADKSMQLHRVPYPQPQPFSEFLLIISVISLLFAWISSFLV